MVLQMKNIGQNQRAGTRSTKVESGYSRTIEMTGSIVSSTRDSGVDMKDTEIATNNCWGDSRIKKKGGV